MQGNEPWANQFTPETHIQGKANDAVQGNVKSDVQENAEGNIQENMQDAVQGVNLNPEGEIPHTNQAVSRDKGRYTRLQRHLEGYERLRFSFVETEDDSGYLIPQKKSLGYIRPQSRNDGDPPTAVDIPSCQRFTFEAVSRETGIDAGRTRPHSQYMDIADYCSSFPGHHDNKKTDKRLKNTYPEGKSHDYIDIVDDVESCPSHTESASNPADEAESIGQQRQEEGESLPPHYQSATTQAVSMVTEDTTSFKGHSANCDEMMDSRQDTNESENTCLEKISCCSVEAADHTACPVPPSGKVKVKNQTVSGSGNHKNKREDKEQWTIRYKKPTNPVREDKEQWMIRYKKPTNPVRTASAKQET